MEYTFDWRIYMKKVPIKELREDLKEELKEANPYPSSVQISTALRFTS